MSDYIHVVYIIQEFIFVANFARKSVCDEAAQLVKKLSVSSDMHMMR